MLLFYIVVIIVVTTVVDIIIVVIIAVVLQKSAVLNFAPKMNLGNDEPGISTLRDKNLASGIYVPSSLLHHEQQDLRNTVLYSKLLNKTSGIIFRKTMKNTVFEDSSGSSIKQLRVKIIQLVSNTPKTKKTSFTPFKNKTNVKNNKQRAQLKLNSAEIRSQRKEAEHRTVVSCLLFLACCFLFIVVVTLLLLLLLVFSCCFLNQMRK